MNSWSYLEIDSSMNKWLTKGVGTEAGGCAAQGHSASWF